jgi:DNA-binding transcriptional regulator GbsR (MarR family)
MHNQSYNTYSFNFTYHINCILRLTYNSYMVSSFTFQTLFSTMNAVDIVSAYRYRYSKGEYIMTTFDGLNEEQIKVIEKSRQRVVDSMGTNMDLYGVTMSIGHLYGNMYFHDGPVTLDEMGQEMGMSKTSMSTGMRTLVDLKMINKVWGKGSRKDLYEVERDWHQNFADFFSIKWRKSMEMNINSLNKSLAELRKLLEENKDSEQVVTHINTDIDKMKHAIHYYRWLGQFIDALETGKIYDWIPKVEE